MAEDQQVKKAEVAAATGVTKHERRGDRVTSGYRSAAHENAAPNSGKGTAAQTEDSPSQEILAPGTAVGRYEVIRLVGEGGMARLEHPNVVRIFDFDVACAIPYMAMEFLHGETLASAIERGPLGFTRMADTMLAVCAGVHAAHQAGIVHRDLKPSNIFLCGIPLA